MVTLKCWKQISLYIKTDFHLSPTWWAYNKPYVQKCTLFRVLCVITPNSHLKCGKCCSPVSFLEGLLKKNTSSTKQQSDPQRVNNTSWLPDLSALGPQRQTERPLSASSLSHCNAAQLSFTVSILLIMSGLYSCISNQN